VREMIIHTPTYFDASGVHSAWEGFDYREGRKTGCGVDQFLNLFEQEYKGRVVECCNICVVEGFIVKNCCPEEYWFAFWIEELRSIGRSGYLERNILMARVFPLFELTQNVHRCMEESLISKISLQSIHPGAQLIHFDINLRTICDDVNEKLQVVLLLWML